MPLRVPQQRSWRLFNNGSRSCLLSAPRRPSSALARLPSPVGVGHSRGTTFHTAAPHRPAPFPEACCAATSPWPPSAPLAHTAPQHTLGLARSASGCAPCAFSSPCSLAPPPRPLGPTQAAICQTPPPPAQLRLPRRPRGGGLPPGPSAARAARRKPYRSKQQRGRTAGRGRRSCVRHLLRTHPCWRDRPPRSCLLARLPTPVPHGVLGTHARAPGSTGVRTL